jgi:hypothetical protein
MICLKKCFEGAVKIEKRSKIACPECGYKMPIFKGQQAKCKGLFIKCKNPNCKKIFEIKIECQ